MQTFGADFHGLHSQWNPACKYTDNNKIILLIR